MIGRADLPFERDQSTRFLPWIVALMVFLGTLAVAAATVVDGAVARWDSELTGRITVQVPAARASADAVESLVALLSQTAGIERAVALSPEAARALVEPWLGDAVNDVDLPIPAVIDVEVAPGAAFDTELLAQRLSQAVPGVTVDDHRAWLLQLIRLARSIELIALAVLALIGLTAIIAVIFATRSGLEVHAAIIDLLHVMGARDGYIAGQFQTQAMMLGVRGGLIGSIAGTVVLIALASLTAGIDGAFLPPLTLPPAKWPLLAAVPLVAIVIAMATARFTVLRALAKMP